MDTEAVTAASLLRRARKRAGLSQVELAARAGVTQSVISAYEGEKRQPSMPVLAALVDAAGFDLVMGLRRHAPEIARLAGSVGRRVRRKRHDLVGVAAARGIRNLRVFGSVARGEDRADSDVDMLADIPPGMSLFGLGRVQADMEAMLGARVDLIPAQDLKPGVRARIEQDLVTL